MAQILDFRPSHETCMRCHGIPDHKDVREGYFKIKKGDLTLKVCTSCIVKYPSLMFSSHAEMQKITKVYRFKGKYLRRKYGGNHYALSEKEPLLEVLKELKNKGYRVPLFGKKLRQIAVTEKYIPKENEVNTIFNISIKLSFWEDIRKNKNGYKLVPA